MSLSKKEFRDVSEKKRLRLDEKAMRLLNNLVDNDIARGRDLDLLLSLKEWYETPSEEHRYLTEKQRKLIGSIDHNYDEYDYWHDLCTRLGQAVEDGRVPMNAENFCRSTIEFFNEKHHLTTLQLEQMIRLTLAAEKEKESSEDPQV